MSWPGGYRTPMLLEGRARDALTLAEGRKPIILADETMTAVATPDRIICSLVTDPVRPAAAQLIGARAGDHLRETLRIALPDERMQGTPLYLLLDDLSGATLIGGWARSRWMDDWADKAAANGSISPEEWRSKMQGVCIGFAPGSSALASISRQSSARVVPLARRDDPDGWHPFSEHAAASMRRARRIDVWLDDVINIDASIQDSADAPQGGREAVHEYRLTATGDPQTGRLLSVNAEPRVLPYRECPGATANVHRMVGVEFPRLRDAVLDELRKTAGCTHLNDALRALADAPRLLAALCAAR
jgi:hypothetical protein